MDMELTDSIFNKVECRLSNIGVRRPIQKKWEIGIKEHDARKLILTLHLEFHNGNFRELPKQCLLKMRYIYRISKILANFALILTRVELRRQSVSDLVL